jgi:anti-sigma regulatory factor (Ser/Thr protein kinase)
MKYFINTSFSGSLIPDSPLLAADEAGCLATGISSRRANPLGQNMRQQMSRAARDLAQVDAPAPAVPSPPEVGRAPTGRRVDMGGYASSDLEPSPAAAAHARRFTRAALDGWNLRHLADDAEAIAAELTANAIRAANRPLGTLPAIIFALRHQPPQLILTIWDNGPGRPRHIVPNPDAETGRGLAIVDELSGRNWGWWPTPRSGGKVVWAVLPAPTARPAGGARAPQQAVS